METQADSDNAEDRPAEPGASADSPATPPQPTAAERRAAALLAALTPISAQVSAQAHRTYVEAFVPVAHLEEAARTLKEQLGYSLLSMVTAVDWPDRIEVIYLVYSLGQPHGIYLKANLPREALPECPSLTSVWPGAEFQERETYDLMGIKFVGHPDLRRILTDDDFPGHPLRKDFRIAADYVLMRHLRHGAEGQLASDDAAPHEREVP